MRKGHAKGCTHTSMQSGSSGVWRTTFIGEMPAWEPTRSKAAM